MYLKTNNWSNKWFFYIIKRINITFSFNQNNKKLKLKEKKNKNNFVI